MYSRWNTLMTGFWTTLWAIVTVVQAQEQIVDSNFVIVVEKPAYPQAGPIVAIDEAHCNFHTATGQYRPFAKLLESDGYAVRASLSKFQPGALTGIAVLVIANALPDDSLDLTKPAFTDAECDIVKEWVKAGGSLLLIADHAPFGSAAQNLARRFGMNMGQGWAFDRDETGELTSKLVFSRANGLLGTHSILKGRSPREEISVVKTFTGQSLSVPINATALLAFSANAYEAATREVLNAENPVRNSKSIAGRAQGIALSFGQGRVVALGEAGFLTAQLIRWPDGREVRFGMNVPGSDDQQFALNVMHWLSRLIE